MATTIRPARFNHMNVVLENVAGSLEHFQDRYDAEFVADIPQKELHAYLFQVGGVLFEAFVPHEFLLVARYGAHYLGLEYQADMDVVRRAIAERGIRIARDVTHALHTHPADTFGVAFEFYSGHFRDKEWPLLGRKVRPIEYWRDEHPLGCTGLKRYTLAVNDIEAARAFIMSFLGGEPLYEAQQPTITARAVALQVADSIVEIITPTSHGTLSRHLERYGEGIRSTVFGVRSIEQARRYFAKRGFDVEAGAAPGTLAVPADANLGVIFEFSE